MKNKYSIIAEIDKRQLNMVIYSAIVGIVTGSVIVFYRLILHYAEKFAFWIYPTIKNHTGRIVLWFAILTILGLISGRIIKKHPLLAGSGIPQVKCIVMGYIRDNWITTVILKISGTFLSIIAGLSVGREGPSIQIGAAIGEGFGKRLTAARIEMKVLLVSGASAGLAAAFNAPLAGVMFALEEIFRYFTPILLLSTMTAAVAADFVAKQIFGFDPIFNFKISDLIPLESYWVILLLGIVLGICGAGFNLAVTGTRKIFQKIPISKSYKPLIAFITAGIIGITFPVILCGGEEIIATLASPQTISFLIIVLFSKLAFSMISFGSGAPGGIFYPLLVIGCIIGAIFGKLAISHNNLNPELINNFMALAMAGFFTAIIRAPITGIILIIEMTGSYTQLLPLTLISVIAYLTASLLKSKPIYDSLLHDYVPKEKIISEEDDQKIMVEAIVQHGSPISGKRVREIPFPPNCLLLTIKRGEREFIPKGNIIIEDGDYIVAMTDLNHEWNTRRHITQLTSYEEEYI